MQTGVAFLAGAICSVLAGYLGMQSATKANVRTSQAALAEGEGAALLVAFNGGAVMGLSVASLGLLGVGAFLGLYSDPETSKYISGFAMGASFHRPVSRASAAASTPKQRTWAATWWGSRGQAFRRRPAQPGRDRRQRRRNVGDVAGMGADIFESYVGSIIATIAIGATVIVGSDAWNKLGGAGVEEAGAAQRP